MKILFGRKNVPPGAKFRLHGFEMSYEQWESIQRDANEKRAGAQTKFQKYALEWGITGLLLLPISFIFLFPAWSGWQQFLSGIAMACLVIIFLGIWWRHRKRKYLWTSLAMHGFPICTHCGYDLRGSSDSSQCPECGKQRKLPHEPTPEEHDALT